MLIFGYAAAAAKKDITVLPNTLSQTFKTQHQIFPRISSTSDKPISQVRNIHDHTTAVTGLD